MASTRMSVQHLAIGAPIRVLAYAPRLLIDRNNTDLRYIASLTGLSVTANVAVGRPDSRLIDSIETLKTIIRRAGPRLKLGPLWSSDMMSDPEVTALGRRRHEWDVFYTNSAVPPDGRLGPAIRFDYIHDAPDAHASGAFARDAASKKAIARHCRIVQVSTAAQADAFARVGVPAEKLRVVPFFLPHLAPPSGAALEKHRAREPLRIAFVGHQARRKGLDALLTALTDPRLKDVPFEATIVSELIDGPVAIPASERITHLTSLAREDVMALMARAHVLAVPSRRETFGLVYVEAMAAGAIPIMAAGPQQTDIAAGGCGLALGPDPAAITAALVSLYEEPARRLTFAEAGLAKVALTYAPSVVAAAYEAMFVDALR